MSELSDFIGQLQIVNTHEHQRKQADWVNEKPDVLKLLFDNYVAADLRMAGGTTERIHRLAEVEDDDVEARFAAVAEEWRLTQHTGYGEAVRLAAKHFFDIDEITGPALARAQASLPGQWPPEERVRILKEEGRFDHVQVDDFSFTCGPDDSGSPDILYDLTWAGMSNGFVEREKIQAEVGIEVTDLATLGEACEAIFAKNAPCAIAVKAQHAYSRTLAWRERPDADAARALEAALAVEHSKLDEPTRLCLGDWLWARGVELAARHNLPFKLHTGYYAGHGRMVMERIRPSHLCPLVLRYPESRFVLMHAGYPYEDELVAMAKHFPNVWMDLCWAWAINPRATMRAVGKFLSAAPLNRLFGFGGDTGFPQMSVAYGLQARKWLTRALQGEIDEGDMSEAEAVFAARRILHDNQHDCFDVAGTRDAVARQLDTYALATGGGR